MHPLQVHSYGNRETATAVSHRPRRRLVSRRRHCATPPRTAGRRCGLDGELSRRFHRSRSGPTGRGGLGRMKPMRTRDHGAAEVFDEMPPGWVGSVRPRAARCSDGVIRGDIQGAAAPPVPVP